MKPTTILRAAVVAVTDSSAAKMDLELSQYSERTYNVVYAYLARRQRQANKFLNKLERILKDVEA